MSSATPYPVEIIKSIDEAASMASGLPTPPSSPVCDIRELVHATTSLDLPLAEGSQHEHDVEVSSSMASMTAVDAKINVPPTPEIVGTEAPAASLDKLKCDLCIIEWKCGAQTQQGKPCGREIPDDRRELIDEQLEMVLSLIQTSQDPKPALNRLLMLVHCSSHDAGSPKDSRLRSWRSAVISGVETGRNLDLSVEERITDVVGPLSVQCQVSTMGTVCGRKIGGQKVQNCAKTIRQIIKQEVWSDQAELRKLLKVLEWNRTCVDHVSAIKFKRVSQWEKQLLVALPPTRIVASKVAKAPCDFQVLPKTRAGSRAVTIAPAGEREDPVISQDMTSPGCKILQGSANGLVSSLAFYWPNAYDTAAFEIVAPADPLAMAAQSYPLIRKKVMELLRDRDLLDGYVYAYKVEGNDAYVKIGYTTRSLVDRHKEWAFDCNRQIEQVYPSCDSTPVLSAAHIKGDALAFVGQVHHARRVEALCHAELDHRRIRVYCNACLKQHIEWFEISALEARAVIQKWSKWMTTQPYEPRELRSTTKWRLKASEMDRVSKVKQFVQDITDC